MKTKRRIKAIIKRMEEVEQTSEIIAGKNVLKWVLDDDMDISEIFEYLSEPQSKLSKNMFAYDEKQMIWVMEDPIDRGKVYICNSRPIYTPSFWWHRRELSSVTQEISYGEDFIQLKQIFPCAEFHWENLEEVFQKFRLFFRTREHLEKYIKYFFVYDDSDRVFLTPDDRKNYAAELKVFPGYLKDALEKTYGLKWMYNTTKEGELLWAMKNKRKEL